MHCGSAMDSLPCFSQSLRLSTPMGKGKKVGGFVREEVAHWVKFGLKVTSKLAGSCFFLLKVTCSRYGINRMDKWSKIWTAGHLLLQHKPSHPLSYLYLFFFNIKYF